jgi:hypothetical protein
MKYLILTLWIVIFLSSTALTGDEYVTEEVCPAISGCWVDTKTGECPDCVMERREVTHIHEEEPKEFAGSYEVTYENVHIRFPNASTASLIKFEKCAMTGVTAWATRNEQGCYIYLRGW